MRERERQRERRHFTTFLCCTHPWQNRRDTEYNKDTRREEKGRAGQQQPQTQLGSSTREPEEDNTSNGEVEKIIEGKEVEEHKMEIGGRRLWFLLK